MKRTNNAVRGIFLAAVLLISLYLGLRYGTTHLSLRELIGALLGHDGYATQSVILYSVRLPRVLAAIVAGTGLSLSGVLLQSVTDNALAAPNIIGVNAGAGLGIVLLLTIAPTAFAWSAPVAMLGAIVATLTIVGLSARSDSRASLILAGVAMSTLLGALISCFTYADADLLSSYSAFSVGGFAGVTADELTLPAIAIALCLVISLCLGDRVDLLCLGDPAARTLGVRVRGLRLVAVLCAGVSAASAVSFAGLLGFVGLIVPHIARRLFGNRTRPLLLASAALGSAVCTLADLLGRVAAVPSEIPVGIVMSLVGAPFFLWLLLRRDRTHPKGGDEI